MYVYWQYTRIGGLVFLPALRLTMILDLNPAGVDGFSIIYLFI